MPTISFLEALITRLNERASAHPTGPNTRYPMTLSHSLLSFAAEGSGNSNSWMLFLILGVVWLFVLIIPARKEKKRKEEMLAGLKKGDRVLLNSGLVAKIANVKADDMIVLDVDGTKMTYLKSSVANLYVQAEGATEKK